MFCKNCGNKLLDGDRFCGNCGQPQSEEVGKSATFSSIKMNDTGLIKLFKNYFVKPVSFFSELKGENLLQSSVVLLLGLPIVYGLLNLLYTSALISSMFNMLKKLPALFANAKIISEKEAMQAAQELMMSNQVLDAKSRINSLIDNKDVFINGAGQILVVIILTAVVLAILNSLMLKNKISFQDIIFISAASYIPLVLAMFLASLATFISITFGILILISGYILSFITLYNGIKEFSDEESDKVFILMTILFILISVILSICIVTKLESSLMSIMNLANNLKGFY